MGQRFQVRMTHFKFGVPWGYQMGKLSEQLDIWLWLSDPPQEKQIWDSSLCTRV